MGAMNIIVIFVLIVLTSGCATLSNREKTLVTMGIVGVATGTVGAITAPGGESQLAHGAMWGGLGSATVGALSLFIFDEDAKRKEAETKAQRLEKELASYREDSVPELISNNRLGTSRPLPDKFRHLVTPGEWSLYRVDRWAASGSGENELVHQDMIFRFNQPQLNPSGKAPVAEGGK